MLSGAYFWYSTTGISNLGLYLFKLFLKLFQVVPAPLGSGPRQSEGGKFIQTRLERRSPLLKATAFRGG